VSVERRYPDLAQMYWKFVQQEDGGMTRDQVHLLLLMDIRSELQKLNAALAETACAHPQRSRRSRSSRRRKARKEAR
jgi:hypothetical protein